MGIGAIIGGALEAGGVEAGIGAAAGAGLAEGGAALAGGFGAAEAFGGAEAFGAAEGLSAGIGAEAFGGAELGALGAEGGFATEGLASGIGSELGFEGALGGGELGFADAGLGGAEAFGGAEGLAGEAGVLGGEFGGEVGGFESAAGEFGSEYNALGAGDALGPAEAGAPEAGVPSEGGTLGEPDPLGTFGTQGDPTVTQTDQVTGTGQDNLNIRDDPYPGDQTQQAARAGGRGSFGSFNPGSLLSSLMQMGKGASHPAALDQASGVAGQLQGEANTLLSNYNQGLLSAPMMANLQSTLQGNLNKIRQLYRSSGRYNSTDRVQAENQAYLQATASMATALQQELTTGLQALGQAGALFGQVANATIASDNAYRSSLNSALGSILKIPTSGGLGSGGGGFPGMNANDTSGINSGSSVPSDQGFFSDGADNFADAAA